MDTSEKLNTKGIGLGLYITKKIINIYEGEIICKSKAGQGSNFIFIVALRPAMKNKNFLNRILNPVKRIYPKLLVQKKEPQNNNE